MTILLTFHEPSGRALPRLQHFCFSNPFHRTLFSNPFIPKMLCNLFWTFPLRGVWCIKPLCANTRTHPPTRPQIIVLSFSETERQRNTAQNILVLVFHRVLIAVSIYMHFIRSLYTNKSDFWLKSFKTQALFMIRDTNATVYIFLTRLSCLHDMMWSGLCHPCDHVFFCL